MVYAYDGTYFCCAWCQDDDDPDPRFRRADKELCVRCNRAVQQAQKYTLTIAQVNGILRFQRDACALCREEPDYESGFPDGTTRTFWHIDHDHACCAPGGSCGRCVRGMLCLTCNATRLPAYERLPEMLRDSPRFNDYLRNPPARHPHAQSTSHDLGGPRGAFSSILDAFFSH